MSALLSRTASLYQPGFGSVCINMTFAAPALFLVSLGPPLLHRQRNCLSVLLRHPLFGLIASLSMGRFGFDRQLLARSAPTLNANTTTLSVFQLRNFGLDVTSLALKTLQC